MNLIKFAWTEKTAGSRANWTTTYIVNLENVSNVMFTNPSKGSAGWRLVISFSDASQRIRLNADTKDEVDELTRILEMIYEVMLKSQLAPPQQDIPWY